jgi:hypothetical protein
VGVSILESTNSEDLGLDTWLVVSDWVEELFACDSAKFDHDDGDCWSTGPSSGPALFWSCEIFIGGKVTLVDDAQLDISKSHTTPCFLQLEQVG